MATINVRDNRQVIDYLARDYDSFRRALLDLIPAKLPEWTDRSEANFGVVLIELFAYLADILSYYADHAATFLAPETLVVDEEGGVGGFDGGVPLRPFAPIGQSPVAPVARQEASEIFDSQFALESRFEQIPDLPHHSRQRAVASAA